MFGRKKKSVQSELRKLVDQVGLDAVCQRCAEIVGAKITNMKVFHQFENGGAKLGHGSGGIVLLRAA